MANPLRVGDLVVVKTKRERRQGMKYWRVGTVLDGPPAWIEGAFSRVEYLRKNVSSETFRKDAEEAFLEAEGKLSAEHNEGMCPAVAFDEAIVALERRGYEVVRVEDTYDPYEMGEIGVTMTPPKRRRKRLTKDEAHAVKVNRKIKAEWVKHQKAMQKHIMDSLNQ